MFQEALAAGHEIGNHTQSHSCATIRSGNQVLEDYFGMHISTMAAPNGDVWIDSVENVGSYWIAQKMFSSISPSGQTWSWQLPNNFPTGKCLRITVDGGTVSQDDQNIAWDDHGYYQIALDAGSVTLTP